MSVSVFSAYLRRGIALLLKIPKRSLAEANPANLIEINTLKTLSSQFLFLFNGVNLVQKLEIQARIPH